MVINDIGKQTLSFKTMHFGIFGLSAFRFTVPLYLMYHIFSKVYILAGGKLK